MHFIGSVHQRPRDQRRINIMIFFTTETTATYWCASRKCIMKHPCVAHDERWIKTKCIPKSPTLEELIGMQYFSLSAKSSKRIEQYQRNGVFLLARDCWIDWRPSDCCFMKPPCIVNSPSSSYISDRFYLQGLSRVIANSPGHTLMNRSCISKPPSPSRRKIIDQW